MASYVKKVARIVETPGFEVRSITSINYLPQGSLYRVFLRGPGGTLLMVIGYTCGERCPAYTAFPYNVEIYEVSEQGEFNPERALYGRGVRTREEVHQSLLAYTNDLTTGVLEVRGEGDRVSILRSLTIEK
jgi:hypothetical protein